MTTSAHKYVVARAEDIPEGSRLIVTIGGRSIGIFNVDGQFYALLNRCPHRGAELCKGDVIGLVVSERPGDVRLEGEMKLLACPAHGWEYDMATGESWFDPRRGRARPLEVHVEAGGVVAEALASGTAILEELDGAFVDPRTHRLKGPYTAQVFPVNVENEYIVLSVAGLRTGTEE
jgi:3-phenylpropionate/trans-cinnamate dioxygenase ferredoxin subunit